MAAINSSIFLFLLATTTVFLHATTAAPAPGSARNPGGYVDIPDVKHNTKVQELGRFAVEEENKKINGGLTFKEVVKGETQAVNGTNYRLTICAVLAGAGKRYYQAIVYVAPKPQSNRVLISFFSLLGPAPGSLVRFPPIPIGPYEIKLGKFAVQEHNNQSHDHLVFSEVLRAVKVPVNGYLYILVISALRNGVPNNYQAVVYVLANKPDQLSSFTILPPTGPPTLPPPAVGTYKPIPNVKNNAKVQELGRFAVQEYNNKFNIVGNLSFSEVVEAKQQIVAGTNYYLYISAVDSRRAADLYEAYLFESLRGNKKLTSFKRHEFTAS